MRSGIVIGKFMPPHAGHAFVIDTARAQVDHLYVVVCDKAGQSISGALRARWLRQLHPDVDVRVVADVLPDDDSPAWAAYTRAFLGHAPNVVFTSESYGDAYAAELGALHVCVDRARVTIPVSATLVRGDPPRYRTLVAPVVWAYLVPRIAVVGAESTGKTTLCARLSDHFAAPWVAEYGREYTIARNALAPVPSWRDEDFVHIAREQQRREDAAARYPHAVLLCDTDAFATEIWRERYLAEESTSRSDEPALVLPRGWPARDRPIDHYLVPAPSVPFVQDGIRDGEHLRAWMHERFLHELDRRSLPYTVLEGDYDERFARAVVAVTQTVADERRIAWHV